MSWQKNLGNGVAPDVAFSGGLLCVTWGHEPLVFEAYGAMGAYLVRHEQPRGYFPKTDSRSVVYHDGAKFWKWAPGYAPVRIPGIPVGNNPAAISPAGVCYYQRATDGQFGIGVYCESVLRGPYRPTGIWEAHDDGTYVMMDNARAVWSGGYVHSSGPVSVGEGGSGGTLIHYDGNLRILLPGDDECRWPRVAVSGERVAIVSWGSRGMRLWCGTLDELKQLPLADGSQPPVEPPMPETPNHLSTVQAVRAGYPAPQYDDNGELTNPLGNKRAWQITNEVAWLHRGEGFGLRFKPTGNNWIQNGVAYAVDIVFHKPSNQFVDVLGSSETVGTPQWSHAIGAVADEWRAPIDPATITGPYPPPTDPPLDPPAEPPVEPPATDLDVRVLALEEDLMRLREAMTGWIIR